MILDNKFLFEDVTYDELNKGNPVVLQVTQKRSNEGLRHFVTVVGYSSNVTSSPYSFNSSTKRFNKSNCFNVEGIVFDVSSL